MSHVIAQLFWELNWRGNLGRGARSWEYVSQLLCISSTSFSVYFCQYCTTEQPWVLICGDCVTIGFSFLIALQFVCGAGLLSILYFFTSFAECFHTLQLLEVQKVFKQCLSWVNSEKLSIIFIKILLLFRFPQIKYKDKVTHFFSNENPFFFASHGTVWKLEAYSLALKAQKSLLSSLLSLVSLHVVQASLSDHWSRALSSRCWC